MWSAAEHAECRGAPRSAAERRGAPRSAAEQAKYVAARMPRAQGYAKPAQGCCQRCGQLQNNSKLNEMFFVGHKALSCAPLARYAHLKFGGMSEGGK